MAYQRAYPVVEGNLAYALPCPHTAPALSLVQGGKDVCGAGVPSQSSRMQGLARVCLACALVASILAASYFLFSQAAYARAAALDAALYERVEVQVGEFNVALHRSTHKPDQELIAVKSLNGS